MWKLRPDRFMFFVRYPQETKKNSSWFFIFFLYILLRIEFLKTSTYIWIVFTSFIFFTKMSGMSNNSIRKTSGSTTNRHFNDMILMKCFVFNFCSFHIILISLSFFDDVMFIFFLNLSSFLCALFFLKSFDFFQSNFKCWLILPWRIQAERFSSFDHHHDDGFAEAALKIPD